MCISDFSRESHMLVPELRVAPGEDKVSQALDSLIGEYYGETSSPGRRLSFLQECDNIQDMVSYIHNQWNNQKNLLLQEWSLSQCHPIRTSRPLSRCRSHSKFLQMTLCIHPNYPPANGIPAWSSSGLLGPAEFVSSSHAVWAQSMLSTGAWVRLQQ